MKTKLALAVSAALVASTAIAQSDIKFNTTGQSLNNIKGTQATFKPEKKTISAWMVQLNSPSISDFKTGSKVSAASALSNVDNSQRVLISKLQTLNSEVKVLDQTKILANSIIVDADSAALDQISKLSEVKAVLPLYDYEINVDASAEYINAKELVTNGIASGKGQRVAVLDTGVDYTHAAIGGSGKVEDYEAAVATADQPVNWPQGKVIGGYDFINDDPNPIDAGTNHGTHVSHSVLGIAPDVELYVYSVCGGGCPGLAQFQALEAAMDPNSDGDISDRVDTVNMSLGGNFGDVDGGAVQVLIDQMVELGVNLVISAGNDGPTPFIVGGPSTSNNALSVGAMTHPEGQNAIVTSMVGGEEVTAYASGFNPELDFSFNNETAPLVYPEANQDGCLEFAEDVDFSGKAVIIDRGGCAFTDKVLNAQARGASFVVIANNSEGEFFSPGGFAEGITIPSVGINQDLGNTLKAQIEGGAGQSFSFVSKSFDDSGAIATFTSRGPSIAGTLKPEITAPGTAILTAQPGLGDGLTPISGTSFSAPITAGALSIIREAHEDRDAFEIKAIAMNTANLAVYAEPIGLNRQAELAPISYVGAGLVDVKKAVNTPIAAWDKETKQAALAYGLVSVKEKTSVTKTVTVKNYSDSDQTYTLNPRPRFADDADTGALTFTLPDSVIIPAGESIEVEVTAHIDPSKLPAWNLHSALIGDLTIGENGLSEGDAINAASAELTRIEFDGSIEFLNGNDKAIHVVYHMLPKPTDNAEVSFVSSQTGNLFFITNTGGTAIDAPFSSSLIATDPIEKERRHDLTAGSTEFFPNSACDSGFVMSNTVQVRDPVLYTLPASYQADFDVDNDGEWDFVSQTAREEWFTPNGSDLTGLVAFNHPYGVGRGSITPAIHNAGNNYVTTLACSEDVGITKQMFDEKATVKVRYRVESTSYSPVASDSADTVEADLVVAPSTSQVRMLSVNGTNGASISSVSTSDVGEEISVLQPGESALLEVVRDPNTQGVLVLTDTGNLDVEVNYDTVYTNIMIKEASFSVDKGTEAGSVLGQLDVYSGDIQDVPVSGFSITENSSELITVNAQGQLIATQAIDQSTADVMLKVKAIDVNGDVSDNETTITVAVNNTAPVISLENVSAQENSEVTVAATVEDAEEDKLTLTWAQTGGEATEFTESEDQLSVSFTAPAGSGEFTFSLTASDGREEVTESSTVTVTVTPAPEPTPEPKKKKSSGSLGWLALLLTPVAFLRRRK
ncbi:S8 family serine peptidase [Shewanella sp. 202IG2-18]|uniref:S8 family serine peptidase n=1 Tax=Parashewanella hymeniacidonis TaxID=2807618 RepID=UPI001960B22C|nr:S8 family serine peptidase [Parashewanella hymeniacidonis]